MSQIFPMSLINDILIVIKCHVFVLAIIILAPVRAAHECTFRAGATATQDRAGIRI